MSTRTQIIVDITVVMAFSLLIHYGIYQHREINELENLFSLSIERNRINDDQLREITYSLINGNHENDIELAKNQGRSEGILVAIKDPSVTEEYHGLWHDGYYQGLAQNEYSIEDISESSYKEGYHSGVDDALRDAGITHPEYTEREQTQDIAETSSLDPEIIKGRAKLRAILEPEFDKKIKDLIDDQKAKLTNE